MLGLITTLLIILITVTVILVCTATASAPVLMALGIVVASFIWIVLRNNK